MAARAAFSDWASAACSSFCLACSAWFSYGRVDWRVPNKVIDE